MDIADQQRFISVSPRRLRRLVRQALTDHGAARARVSVALVDSRAIRRLNRRFLSQDCPTDVLSFPLCDDPASLQGEVVANAERALSVARRRRVVPEGELFLYVVHGVLHLLGHDDADEHDARAMHRCEEAVLARFGYPHAYWHPSTSRRQPSATTRQNRR